LSPSASTFSVASASNIVNVVNFSRLQRKIRPEAAYSLRPNYPKSARIVHGLQRPNLKIRPDSYTPLNRHYPGSSCWSCLSGTGTIKRSSGIDKAVMNTNRLTNKRAEHAARDRVHLRSSWTSPLDPIPRKSEKMTPMNSNHGGLQIAQCQRPWTSRKPE
jgi:hypothetical protein